MRSQQNHPASHLERVESAKNRTMPNSVWNQCGIEFWIGRCVLGSAITGVIAFVGGFFRDRYRFHEINLLHFGSVENSRLGPSPCEPRHTGAPLSPERRIALSALRSAKSPIRVRDLVDQLDLHENTIREHLEGLVKSAHAERVQLISSGRGRPSYGYRAREDFAAQIEPEARDYAPLALVLARQLAAIGGDSRRVAISAGEEWARHFFNSPQELSESKIAIRKRIFDVLKSLGYSPKSDAKLNSIRLRTCPLLSAARLEPEIVCSVHLGLVRGFVSQAGGDPDEVELLQFDAPGSCRLVVP